MAKKKTAYSNGGSDGFWASIWPGLLFYAIILLIILPLMYLLIDFLKVVLKKYLLQLFFIVLLVSLPMVIKKLYPYRDTSRAIPVLLLGTIYIQTILIFGAIYYFIYLWDNTSYVFAGPLENKQATLFFTGKYRLIQKQQKRLYNVALWKQWVLSHDSTEFNKARDASYNLIGIASGLSSSYTIKEFEYETSHTISLLTLVDGDAAFTTYTIELRDGDEKYWWTGTTHMFKHTGIEKDVVSAQTRFEHVKALERIERNLQAQINDQLASLRGTRRMWAFGGYDIFVYFSASTMATASYGDILPNSGLLRCLTTLEIMVGIFLIAFGIRLFVGGKRIHSDD